MSKGRNNSETDEVYRASKALNNTETDYNLTEYNSI